MSQPHGDMGTHELPRDIRRHTLEATIFQVIETQKIYRKGQKRLKIIALLMNYFSRTTYITTGRTPKSWHLLLRAVPWTSRSPVYFDCLYNGLKSVLKFWQSLKEPMFWPHPTKTHEKFARSRNLHQHPLLYTSPNLLLKGKDTQHFEACLTR